MPDFDGMDSLLDGTEDDAPLTAKTKKIKQDATNIQLPTKQKMESLKLPL